MEKLEFSHIVGGNIKQFSYVEKFWQFFKRLNTITI